MATIPVYGGAQVQETALRPNQMAVPDVSSGSRALAGALAGTAEVIDRIQVRDAQDEAWRTNQAINEDFIKFDAEERKRSQGINAQGYAERVTAWWDKAREVHGKDLSPLAKQAVGKQLGQSRLQALGQATSFQERELERSRVEALDGSLTSEVNKGIAAGNGAGSASNMREMLQQYATAQGKTPEWTEQQLQRYATPMHATVIAQLQKDDPAAAELYFKTHKDEIDGKQWDNITKGLNEASAVRKAQTFADEVMTKSLPFADALAAAREKYDGEQEARVVQELKTRYAEKEATDNLETKTIAKTAWSQLMAGGSMSRVDPKVMADLRAKAPEEERQMRDWLDAKHRQAKADRENRNDPDESGRYYSFVRMAMDEPNKFAQLDLSKVQPYVSKAQWNHLIGMQTGVNKADAKAMDSQRQVKATIDMVKGSILSAGIDLTPKEGSKKAQELNNFMGAVSQALLDAQAAQPDKPLTNEQMKAIGMSMLKEGYEQGSGIFGLFPTKKRGYEIVTGDGKKTYVETRYKDIPVDIRNKLEADMPKTKSPSIYGNGAAQEQAIERAYQRGREQGIFK